MQHEVRAELDSTFAETPESIRPCAALALETAHVQRILTLLLYSARCGRCKSHALAGCPCGNVKHVHKRALCCN
jgi:hypothetical protein